jgi:hypothetical protein
MPKFELPTKPIPQLNAIQEMVPKLEALEKFLPKITELNALIAQIEAIETGQQPKEAKVIHGWNRLKLLSKFALIASKGREIELEWQRIQQDSHDATFALRSGRGTEVDESYKRGIVDGIKWCEKLFS